MKTFITDDFLLYNDIAKELYHNNAKDLPIIDYHNHLPPDEILEDKKYSNITEIWLNGDHYKWRAMRANGVGEPFITGEKSDYEKFLAWAKTVPHTLGNPLYHWTHLELLRYFDIDQLLDESSADDIWEKANEKLNSPEMSVRSLLGKENVEFLGTTDDPTDDLATHAQLQKEEFTTRVSPSFRPDKGLNIEKEDFQDWISQLERATELSIESYEDFLQALEKRISYFSKHGCKSSDHSISTMFYEEAMLEDVSIVFLKKLQNVPLTKKEIEQFKTYTLLSLAEMYAEQGWAMQFHFGALRNNHTRMLEQLGPDTGFDSIGDHLLAEPLAKFLDALEKKEKLPKTIFYALNPRDNYILASMAGNFQNDELPGKIQFGTAWWFNDHIDGMEFQMKTLANIGLLSHFIGMLTDSRSFLSFSRHEYFRRILCNILGTWAEEGKAPQDIKLLGQYVKNICYDNAKRYFDL